MCLSLIPAQALSRYASPDPTLLLPDASTAPTSKDINTWVAWVDSVETRLERMQVVELPRLVAVAKGTHPSSTQPDLSVRPMARSPPQPTRHHKADMLLLISTV